MKLPKSYGCGVHHRICGYQLAHIPETQDTEADSFSSNFNEAIEWKLSTYLFQKISNMFGNLTFDLFATHINQKTKTSDYNIPIKIINYITVFVTSISKFIYFNIVM